MLQPFQPFSPRNGGHNVRPRICPDAHPHPFHVTEVGDPQFHAVCVPSPGGFLLLTVLETDASHVHCVLGPGPVAAGPGVVAPAAHAGVVMQLPVGVQVVAGGRGLASGPACFDRFPQQLDQIPVLTCGHRPVGVQEQHLAGYRVEPGDAVDNRQRITSAQALQRVSTSRQTPLHLHGRVPQFGAERGLERFHRPGGELGTSAQ